MTNERDEHGPLARGRIVHGTVVARHPWGVELALEEAEASGTVDIRFLSDDPADMNMDRFPLLGARLRAIVQGMMPNGQLRLSLRASDLERAD
jgi:hypothetical protein